MLAVHAHNPLPSVHLVPCLYSLSPLLYEEFHVFAVRPNSGIGRVALRELQFDWQNAHHEKTTYTADNLFECGKSLAEAYPALLGKGKLVRAVFDVHLAGHPRPYKLSICPPNHFSFDFPGDAGCVLRWLEECRIRQPRRRLAGPLCLLALIAFGTVVPLSDGDPDDDLRRPRCTRLV